MSSFVVEAGWGSTDRVLFVSVVRAGSAVLLTVASLGLGLIGYVLITSSCPVGAGRVCTDYVFLSGWNGSGMY